PPLIIAVLCHQDALPAGITENLRHVIATKKLDHERHTSSSSVCTRGLSHRQPVHVWAIGIDVLTLFPFLYRPWRVHKWLNAVFARYSFLMSNFSNLT